MTTYDDPSDLTAIEQGVAAKQESKSQTVIKSLDPKILAILGLGTLFLIYLYYSKQIEVKLAAIMFVGIAGLAFLLGQAQIHTKPYLTYEECCYMLDKHLKFMKARRWGAFSAIDPQSTYYITPITRKRYLDTSPWKRAIGVMIVEPSGLEIPYLSEIDIRDGDLTSFIQTYECWDGRKMDDVRTVWKPGDDLKNNKMANKFLGVAPRRLPP